MDILKTIYFTITAPTLDTTWSNITIVSDDGTIADWCQFGGFEQVDEKNWRLIVNITGVYTRKYIEDKYRYAYITGILLSEGGDFCKHITIDDNFRIRQEGCVDEGVILMSTERLGFSQDCEYVIFEDYSTEVQSPCIIENITLVSTESVLFEQYCEFAELLLDNPSETTLTECEFIDIMGAENVSFKNACDWVALMSTNAVEFTDNCGQALLLSSPDVEFTQECSFIVRKSDIDFEFTHDCQSIGILSCKRNIFAQPACPYVTEIPSEATQIVQYCPLEFTSIGNSTISLFNSRVVHDAEMAQNYTENEPDVKYSLNGGETWVQWDYNTIYLSDGDSVLMKGTNPSGFSKSELLYSQFTMTGNISVRGNIMYLVDETGESTDLNGMPLCFYYLFARCTSLVTAPELPATTLAEGCYYGIFKECTNLVSGPSILPAARMPNSCYREMFLGCTSLVSAPKIMGTTAVSRCCDSMFEGCQSLVSVADLRASTVDAFCFSEMFRDCTSLAVAPALPATTLVNSCYRRMFQGCSNLIIAPELGADILGEWCCAYMFYDCSMLSASPELKAETLESQCYAAMFIGCTALTSITCLATDITEENCTLHWLDINMPGNGTFYCPSGMSSQWDLKGTYSGKPAGWIYADV